MDYIQTVATARAAQKLATADRECKLQDLKLKLVASCCQSLLNPPLPYVGALRFDKDDSDEDKEMKRKEHALRKQERDDERIRREPELLRELDKIIERVRQARSEYTKPEVDYLANNALSSLLEYRCKQCHNRNSDRFVVDVHTGDTTCMECGCVIEEHHIDQSQVKRNFEDKPDQGHHGPAPNPLMPDSWNTRTSISRLKPGSQSVDPEFKRLAFIHDQVEMNLSTIGQDRDERHTRIGYKNIQKSKVGW